MASTDAHTHLFNGPFSGTTPMSRHQKGKTNLDFTEARDSEWQWHQLGHMQVCTSLQTDNHASIPTLSFLQAGCRSCRPTNSVKALKAIALSHILDGSKSPSRKGALCRETPTLHWCLYGQSEGWTVSANATWSICNARDWPVTNWILSYEKFTPCFWDTLDIVVYHVSASTHTHTRLTALFRDYPGELVPER